MVWLQFLVVSPGAMSDHNIVVRSWNQLMYFFVLRYLESVGVCQYAEDELHWNSPVTASKSPDCKIIGILNIVCRVLCIENYTIQHILKDLCWVLDTLLGYCLEIRCAAWMAHCTGHQKGIITCISMSLEGIVPSAHINTKYKSMLSNNFSSLSPLIWTHF